MSSNLSISLATSKTGQPPPQVPSPSQSSSSSCITPDWTQRRGSGTSTPGAGSSARSTYSTARNAQSLRKQHKGHRRPRLADEDAVAESAAMQSTNSRKGQKSITHLMNFTLPPRPQNHHTSNLGRNYRRNPTWGLGSGYHAADKARYIHANYRFIVNPTGDYTAQATDADIHLDWNNVLQILVSALSQSTNCPICLSTPTVPRMAKCGHLFCLPCLIRYMHSSDNENPTLEKRARWKKCPICWDSVYISETRPVRWFTGQELERPQEGDDIVLRLIKRQPGSTLALPRDGADVLENFEEVPWYFAAEVMDYARIMRGSEDYMKEQYDREIEELQQLEREDEMMFGDDTQWTRKAVASVSEAKEKLNGIGNPPTIPEQPTERQARRPPISYKPENSLAPEFYDIQQASKSGQSASRSPMPHQSERSQSLQDEQAGQTLHESSQSSLPLPEVTHPRKPPKVSYPLPSSPSLTRNRKPSFPFFFYEALLHYYLSPLDIRILKAAFGDYAMFPSTILPRVEHVSTGHIVDDELRRRAKYLAHLPHGCEVAFLECNWTDVVAPGILDAFATEIDRRRKRNREKEMREEKERARAEKEEDDKRWAAARRRRPNVQEATTSEVELESLVQMQFPEVGEASSSPPWNATRTQTGSAFASLASPSTSPATARTVWGTRIIPSAPTEPINEVQESEVSENDGWLANWEQDLLQDDIFTAQVEEQSPEPGGSKLTNGTGKKKKGKKITLMTTNARRGA